MDYLDHFPAWIRRGELEVIRSRKLNWVNQEKKGFLRYRNPFQRLSKFEAQTVECGKDAVIIGDKNEISEAERSRIREDLKSYMPWRKGPFSVFGIDIDAEWRSELKWQRLEPKLPDLSGKLVADIGCNNGYYMFRMTPYRPEFVLGFEPSVQHYYCFKALNAMAGFKNLDIDLLGVEHIGLYPETFDVIFLMGVIYHRSSPVDILREILSALKPGGTLMIESQAIPGDKPLALFPEKTYAKVPGTYFVPTGVCLEHWLRRAGYANVELFSSQPMSSHEQRATDWMVFESFQDFIDPDNPEQTVEGYPAPWRVLLRADKL